MLRRFASLVASELWRGELVGVGHREGTVNLGGDGLLGGEDEPHACARAAACSAGAEGGGVGGFGGGGGVFPVFPAVVVVFWICGGDFALGGFVRGIRLIICVGSLSILWHLVRYFERIAKIDKDWSRLLGFDR